ncbi:MAG TPA: hypothetical protein VJ805_11920 [Nitrospiraceae bacterium]|nr:hypothetical protein [Nitrospiraceae bacterium]
MAKGDDSKFSIATTVTLALAVAALVLVKEPLKSSRPSGTGTEMNGVSKELKARARLWEDPFSAVLKQVESRKKNVLTLTEEVPLSQGSGVGLQKSPETVRVTMQSRDDRSEDDGLNDLKKDITDRIRAGESITALLVMTAGGPYANDSESRIGDRYALEAALDVGCFAPESTEFVRYFTWRFRGAPVTTPYEWYGRNKVTLCENPRRNIDRVLVLWVKADDYKDRVLAGIHELVTRVLAETNEGRASRRTNQHSDIKLDPQLCPRAEQPAGAKSVPKDLCERIVFKLMGPRSSTELLAMLREIQARQESKEPGFSWPFKEGRIGLYSPWATAMPGLLAYGMKSKERNECLSYQACREAFGDWFSQANIRFDYRIDNDKVLFDELFRELDRRQVTIGQDRIVLIGEWDSFYARALPITFSAAACHYIGDATITKLNSPPDDVARAMSDNCTTTETAVDALLSGKISPHDLNITRYSYLSGLDGESLEDQQKRSRPTSEEKEKENAVAGKLKLRGTASYEKPEGTSQLDYVRRLVSRIKSEEDDGPSSQQRRVKAIGILGRDAYDALLILQAVREQFPTVLFFGTDLYARYFHDSELKWTRNLLIVSHFGLQLDQQLQRSIPPLRNTYQTSTFLAALLAIDRIVESRDREDCMAMAPSCYLLARGEHKITRYSAEISPRLYEIGRSGAVDLSINASPTRARLVHPPRDDVEPDAKTAHFPPGMWRIWILAVAVLSVILWCYARLWNWLRASEGFDGKARAGMRVLRASCVILPALAMIGFWIAVRMFDYEEDEPFSWSDGVSIWPTELIRLLGGLLSIWFLIKGRVDLIENTKEVTRRYFPSFSERSPNTAPRHGFWSNVDWMVHGSPGGGPIAAADLWARYYDAHRWSQRAGRVLLLLLLYFASIGTIWPLLNDGQWSLFVPCRGPVSCGVDRIAVMLSVVMLVTLNLSVFDAVLLAARWISELQRTTDLSAVAMAHLIGDRTRIVNRRILYPFIVLFLVIGARSHYFDNWDFPPALLVALIVESVVALASACILYMAAINTRRRVVHDLEATSIIGHGEGQDNRSDRVRKTIDEIGSIQQGAFVPFYQQPVVQAGLVAALAFLQYWFLGQ